MSSGALPGPHLSSAGCEDGESDVDSGVGGGHEEEECFIKWTPPKLLKGMKGVMFAECRSSYFQQQDRDSSKANSC